MRGLPSLSPRGAANARRVVAALFAAGVLTVLGSSSSACGTDPVGVDACRRIERVRCESAHACGIDLRRPPHSGDQPKNDVAACIRYYDDQCLHGLVTTTEPGPQAVDACVDAIITGDCSVVRTPESHVACAFLLPPATPEAGTDLANDDASAD